MSTNIFQKLDNKEFSWFHVKMIIVSGAGFLTDAYDLFNIGMLTNLLGRLYYQDNPYVIYNAPNANLSSAVKPGKLPIAQNAAVTAVALVGTLIGQVFWGYIGDKFGRKSAYGIVLTIMIFASIAQSMSFGTTPDAVITTLCFWRFMLGFGVGGDYPISATIMSEFSSTKNRGAYIGSVFAMQGMGYLLAAAVTAVISAGFDYGYPATHFPVQIEGINSAGVYAKCSNNPSGWKACDPLIQTAYYKQILGSCPIQADYVWRFVLAFGAVPGLLTIYARTKITESPRYTAITAKNASEAQADIELMLTGDVANAAEIGKSNVAAVEVHEVEHLTAAQFFWEYRGQITGCAACWFLLDVAFYSQGLFQKDVFLQVNFIPPAGTLAALEELSDTAKAQALVALGSTIPGYWFTVFFVDSWGRKPIQLMGFIIMTILMGALAGSYFILLNPNNDDSSDLSPNQPTNVNGWIAMYFLTFFFANFGPNSTTFIYPAELFPTAWKSTGHGFSAAWGKAGAIIGAFGFLFASTPAALDITWSFPCTGAQYDYGRSWVDASGKATPILIKTSDLAKNGKACKQKGNCPTGRQGVSTGPNYNCDACIAGALSGCYDYGIGLQGALALLAGTNFMGMLFTFLLPETAGKSLEELNGSAPPTKVADATDNPVYA